MNETTTVAGKLSSLTLRDKETKEEKKYLIQDAQLTERVKTLENTKTEVQVNFIPNGEIEEICQ